MTQDILLICKECKSDFTWPAKDQDFFASKGFEKPKRCKTCIRNGYKAEDGLTAEERQAKYRAEHTHDGGSLPQ